VTDPPFPWASTQALLPRTDPAGAVCTILQQGIFAASVGEALATANVLDQIPGLRARARIVTP
jgi:hypothetical protein